MRFAVFALFTLGVFAQDSADTLARILAEKGTISASELARVQSAPPADRVATLASILEQKGILSSTEAARVAPQSALPAQPAKPEAAKTETAAPAVTAQSRLPVTIYGTLLLNSIYNTAVMNISDIPLFTAKQGADPLGNDKSFAMIAIEGGQDWAVFAPLNPTSYAQYAIPSMSAAGNPWIRVPQLRFEAKTSNFLAQFAAIDPDMGDFNTTTFSEARPPGSGERGRAPGVDARFAFIGKHDDRDFTVGFSGHYAHGKNSGMVNDVPRQVSFDSWGAALDVMLPFSKKFNVSGEAYMGRALGLFSVASGEAVQPVGTFGDRGVRSTGGWAQAQFNFSPKWQVNTVYGIDIPKAQDVPVGSRTRNQNIMGNLMYKYNAHATIAWEYRRILTDFRNQPLSNERGDTFNLALAYAF